LVTRADSSPDIDFNVGGPTAVALSEAARARPSGFSDAIGPPPAEPAAGPDPLPDLHSPPPPEPEPARKRPPPPDDRPEPKPEPTAIPFVADLIAFAGLLIAGAFAGEELVQKGTAEVLSEAGATFPPTELLLWAAPPLLFGLIYLLLNSRGRTVGAWLRRRRRAA
jgi:hypothetical protein